MTTQFYSCVKCTYLAKKFSSVLTHIQNAHGNDPNFSVVCGLEGCGRCFKKIETFRRHVKYKHPNALKNKIVNENIHNRLGQANQNENLNQEVPEHLSEEEITNDENKLKSPEIRELLLKIILKYREVHHLPRGVIQSLTNDLLSFCEHILSINQENVRKILKTKDNNVIGLDENLLFSNNIEVKEAFLSLNSNHKISALCKSEKGLIEPIQYTFSETTGNVKKKVFQYVPIIKVLEKLYTSHEMKNKHVKLNKIPHNCIGHYLQGDLAKTIIKNNQGYSMDTIHLQIYLDEFELVNPLGSKRGKHKTLGCYFSILNLDGKYRAQLSDINLVLLAKSVDIDSFGFREIMKPLIYDLNILAEEGFYVEKTGTKYTTTVSVFSGDNLGQHKLGGFNCNFSSGRICRFCMIQYEDIAHKTSASQVCQRTLSRHKYHLEGIAISKSFGKSYGVRFESPLMKISNFDVTLQLPPDPMHDLQEGVIPSVLKRVLNHMITNQFMKLEDFNLRISSFPFGKSESNRPENQIRNAICGSGNIKGSASELFCLFRLLPLICFSYLPNENDEYWTVYLKLRLIVEYVYAAYLHVSFLVELETLIEEFLNLASGVFGEDALTPKYHYMIHYADAFRKYGPLKAMSCIRFEAKHSYFKKIAHASNNFKNITKTLASRHQYYQCYNTLCERQYNIQETSSGSVLEKNSLPIPLQLLLNNEYPDKLYSVKCATYDNMHFFTGCFLKHETDGKEIQSFVKIQNIFCLNNVSLLLAGIVYKVRVFIPKIFAYEIKEEPENWLLLNPDSLVCHELLDAYLIEGKNYISLRSKSVISEI